MLELGGYSLRGLSWAKRFWGQCVQAELPGIGVNGLCCLNSILRNCTVRAWGKNGKSLDLTNERWLGFFGDRNTNTGINIDSQAKNKIL